MRFAPLWANVAAFLPAMGFMKRIQPFTTVLCITCLGVALPACSPKVDNGGYVLEKDTKQQLVEGRTTKDEVLTALGSPSSQSSFGPETWYYITDRKEAYAFLKPSVVEQDVLAVEFDSGGVVDKIKTYDKNSGKEVDIAKRTTPTEGHTLGFFEQILGNIGRFNSSKDSAAPGRKPNPRGY